MTKTQADAGLISPVTISATPQRASF